ncbi:hypothetical protein [Vibrio parahaemolyticus]|uniref:hypothetical protein n=1 Tax=Vibrio parahaemolyticus TaxID=670 RepID=UPI0004D534D4|nr:hypothetical protein [Vibrio parahaemolyticus]OQT82935.1 hypothetical protein EM98_000140 [Vibrio parahaemolyticus]
MQNVIKIITIPADGGKFNDETHLENFTKYLFSLSKNHPKSDLTQLNTLCFDGNEGANTQPNKYKSMFKKHMKANKIKVSELTYDLNYFVYLFFNKGVLYTNLVEKNKEGKLQMAVDEGTFEIAEMTKKGSKKEIIELFESLLDEAELIYTLQDAPGNVRVQADAYLRQYLEIETGIKGFMSVSHADQGLYHIHRIIRKEREAYA